MNGHFAGVGDAPAPTSFEHGVQVIDGDKEFKYVAHTAGQLRPRVPCRCR
jgi:hypothetical protein